MRGPTSLLAAAGSVALALTGTAPARSQGAESRPAFARSTPAVRIADAAPRDPQGRRHLAQPLVRDLFFAGPSAHGFDGSIYVYPGHEIDIGVPDDDLGGQSGMRDYRVVSMDRPGGKATVRAAALDPKDAPWASKRLWAPDAAYKNGVATFRSPIGSFEPDGSIRTVNPSRD